MTGQGVPVPPGARDQPLGDSMWLSELLVLLPEEMAIGRAVNRWSWMTAFLGSDSGGGRCPVCDRPIGSWTMDARGALIDHVGRAFLCRFWLPER